MPTIDLSHTSHTTARTGIQRVCRSLHAELLRLEPTTTAITHDPFARRWRPLESWETANLSSTESTHRRGAHWPFQAQVKGRLKRWISPIPSRETFAGPLLVPEIFSPTAASALPALFERATGPRVAVFHDAIALRFPEFTPAKTVARFPSYLQELARFDGVAAVSEDSRQCLADFWSWAGVRNIPALVTIPLGVDTATATPLPSLEAPPVILCVGTLEARKNHLALLEACETLWAGGLSFTLELVGMAQKQTGAAALAKIQELQSKGRSLVYTGPVSDAGLMAAYARSLFTIYPSLAEGFGLPILEALSHGRPCVCAAKGAVGEVAAGGGCLTLANVSPAEISRALRHLLESRPTLETLAHQARIRPQRTWAAYAGDLLAWANTCKRR